MQLLNRDSLYKDCVFNHYNMGNIECYIAPDIKFILTA